MKLELQKRHCPLCGSSPENSTEWLAPNYDLNEITDHSFASRKLPEYMTWGYRICNTCNLAYCNSIPTAESLDQSYTESHFSSDSEAIDAAKTYATELEPIIKTLPHRDLAIDIGCGPGPLLAYLNSEGFSRVCGVEPAVEAVNNAEDAIKDQIIVGNFSGSLFQKDEASLICLFQTIEHLSDPRKLFEEVHHVLKPGGRFVVICHDRESWLTKLLNSKSPIIDIEHLQLFNPKSLNEMAKQTGLVATKTKSFWNSYPISYWLLLSPIPKPLKSLVLKFLKASRLSNIKLGVNVGNLVFVCEKPLK